MNKKKVFGFILIVPLGLLTIIALGLTIYYYAVYQEYLGDKSDHIRVLSYYKYIINKKAYPEVYQQSPVSYSSTDLKDDSIYTATIIYDINGKEIGRLSREDRNIIGLNDVSPHFISALINSEDKNFYKHGGVDYSAIATALVQNLIAGKIVRGGSTLTQQLAKLLFTSSEKSLHRKVYEIIITRNIIEQYYDKNDILEMYINYIYFGHNINGIEEAARLYFNKRAKDLDLVESALLVSIIPNPSIYSPFKNIKYSRKKHLSTLSKMSKEGLVDKKIYKQLHKAFWEQHNFTQKLTHKTYKQKINKSPYVIEEVKRQLVSKLLKEQIFEDKNRAYDFLYTKGLRITTYIDLDLQIKAQEIVKNKLEKIRKLITSNKNFSSYDKNKIQAALIAIDPTSGGIKAFVGGDEFNKDNQYNRAFQALRQPGSAFKPILYAKALDGKHITPYTMVLDKYEAIKLKHGKIWEVKNYKNRYENKQITTTKALKISSNQVAARLVIDIGVDKVRDIVQKSLGLDKEESYRRYKKDQYSIALGSVEMTVLELSTLYAMIANKGKKVKPKLIKSIEDITGKAVLLNGKEPQQNIQVISKEAAYLITNMLRQVLSPGGTGYRVKLNSNIEFDIAGKTGTSQDSRDLWFAGFTPELSSVVWVGHDDDKALLGGGAGIAGPIFGEFMQHASLIMPFSRFEIDDSYDLVSLAVCLDSGLIAVRDKSININYNAKFIRGTEPADYCNLEHNRTKNPFNQLLGIPARKKNNDLP